MWFSGALDPIAWMVPLRRLCEQHYSLLSMLITLFSFRYGLGSVLDDERLTMYEDFASTFRGEKPIQDCLWEDLKVSGYFL